MKYLISSAFLALSLGLLAGCGSSSSDTPPGTPGNGNGNGQEPPVEQVPLLEDVSELIPAPPIPTPHDQIPEGNQVFFVSTTGSNQDDGTSEDRPFATLSHAINQVGPGDVIVVRGGVYEKNSTVEINNRSGTAEEKITIFAYPGEEPIFDFTAQGLVNNRHGFRLNASHWHLYGLTIRYAGHNGIRMDGSHNRLERITSHGNYDTGIHMAGGASHNLIMNCDSYDNVNLGSANGGYTANPGNNADGFGAKFDIGPGNHYYGNRAWNNSDDGFDFWRASSTIVLQRNWAFDHGLNEVYGHLTDFRGNGNGFKFGGDGVYGAHVAIGNIAFNNQGHLENGKGFDHNNNPAPQVLIHNTAVYNPRNFSFPNPPPGEEERYIMYNNFSLLGNLELFSPTVGGLSMEGNSWQMDSNPRQSDINIPDLELARSERQPDGSLPDIELFKVLEASAFKEAGVNIGFPFPGEAPEIGAHGYTP